MGLACWAAAVAARVAANRPGKKMCLGVLFMKRTLISKNLYRGVKKREPTRYKREQRYSEAGIAGKP
jgi:hypothetical protein